MTNSYIDQYKATASQLPAGEVLEVHVMPNGDSNILCRSDVDVFCDHWDSLLGVQPTRAMQARPWLGLVHPDGVAMVGV